MAIAQDTRGSQVTHFDEAPSTEFVLGDLLRPGEVAPGKESSAQHCHALEEEIFVVLDGDGVVLLGEDEVPVRPGSVIARPAGTGVAHVFSRGCDGLSLLAFGTHQRGDVCYYPRSNKIAFRGVGVIARLEQLDYSDGED